MLGHPADCVRSRVGDSSRQLCFVVRGANRVGVGDLPGHHQRSRPATGCYLGRACRARRLWWLGAQTGANEAAR